jgi:hypothetical protein
VRSCEADGGRGWRVSTHRTARLRATALLLGLFSAGADGEAPRDPAGAADAPAMSPERLYELALVPLSQVHFAATPGRKRSTEGHAGLATLSLPSAGLYRIALDLPFWVDVIDHGTPIPSRDFEGRPGCHAPHKVVEFELPASTSLTLQFSAGDAATLKVAVLRAPPPREKT